MPRLLLTPLRTLIIVTCCYVGVFFLGRWMFSVIAEANPEANPPGDVALTTWLLVGFLFLLWYGSAVSYFREKKSLRGPDHGRC